MRSFPLAGRLGHAAAPRRRLQAVPQPHPVRVEVDPDDLDLDLVHDWLSADTPWARGRSREDVATAAAASVNLGAFLGEPPTGPLIGYARLVTDRTTHAWLDDLYVHPAARGLGAGRTLLAEAVALCDGWAVPRMVLPPPPFEGFYDGFGFDLGEPRWTHLGPDG